MGSYGSYGPLWFRGRRDHDDDDDRGDDVGDGDDVMMMRMVAATMVNMTAGLRLALSGLTIRAGKQQSAATGTRRAACPANGMTPFPQAVPHPRGR